MHALQHPNVLHFHQWYETTNHLWLILEYCVGGDLLSLIRQDIRLPEASVHDFGRDLVSALLFLHSQGVLYCDLKPSNILLDENGKIKLGDFGLARRLGRSGDPAGGGGGGGGASAGPRATWPPSFSRRRAATPWPRTSGRSAASSTSAPRGTRPSSRALSPRWCAPSWRMTRSRCPTRPRSCTPCSPGSWRRTRAGAWAGGSSCSSRSGKSLPGSSPSFPPTGTSTRSSARRATWGGGGGGGGGGRGGRGRARARVARRPGREPSCGQA